MSEPSDRPTLPIPAVDCAPRASAAGPPPHERARRRMLALARLCVVAAAPVTNTACDPAPEPYCAQSSDADRRASLYADAVWSDESGILLVSLELQVSSLYPLSLGGSVSVVGGTLEETVATAANVLSIKILPDGGTTELRVLGTLGCQGASTAFTVTLDLAGVAEAGAEIPTSID